MPYQHLMSYGLSSRFEQEALLFPELTLARVTGQHRNIYTIVTEYNEAQALVSGKFMHCANTNTDFPVVGDWVMVSLIDTEKIAIIHHVLPRKTTFERRAAGTQNAVQIVASNIDYIFICMSLNNDFNLRRLERYLSIAWQGTATPVVVLTKSDLCTDLANKLQEVAAVSIGVNVLVTSILHADVYKVFSSYLSKEKTVVFLGSSGVGKSSLVNQLLGKDLFLTKAVGSDDSGRHTTTSRQLLVLPNGGVVIDTPGMRELQLDTGNLAKAFEDIESLALQCKYRNCTHTSENRCAIQQAITDGTLSLERLENYRKLARETQYEGLNSRQLEHAKINNMFGSVSEFSKLRRHVKNNRNN